MLLEISVLTLFNRNEMTFCEIVLLFTNKAFGTLKMIFGCFQLKITNKIAIVQNLKMCHLTVI